MWSWKSCGVLRMESRIFGSGHFLCPCLWGLVQPPRAVINKNDINCCNCCLKAKPHGFWIPPNTTHTTLSKNSWHHARVMHVSLFSGHPSDAHLHLKEKIKNSHSMIFARESLFVVISCCYLTSFWSVHAYFLSTRASFDAIHLNRSGISINRIQSLYQGQLAFLYRLMPLSQTKISVQWAPLTWKHQTRNSKNHQRTTGDTLIAFHWHYYIAFPNTSIIFYLALQTFAKDPCPRAIPGVHSPKL